MPDKFSSFVISFILLAVFFLEVVPDDKGKNSTFSAETAGSSGQNSFAPKEENDLEDLLEDEYFEYEDLSNVSRLAEISSLVKDSVNVTVIEKEQEGNASSSMNVTGDDTGEEKNFLDDSPESRSAELLEKLQVHACALIPQSDKKVMNFMKVWGLRNITTCLFSSLRSLVASVMPQFVKGLCFKSRFWTVVLFGTPRWASGIVRTARTRGLYDSRIHWIILVAGKNQPVTPTLKDFQTHHRVTWLRWTDHLQEWVVLVSEPRINGMTALAGGLWMQEDVNSTSPPVLTATRPLRPPYTTNFFGRTLRMVSVRHTDKNREAWLPNEFARCYFTKEKRTRCTGYIGEMLQIILDRLNVSFTNKKVTGCGSSKSKEMRTSFLKNGAADLGMGSCSMNHDRNKVIDFTDFHFVVRSTIGTGDLSANNYAFTIFSVFAWDTWLAIPIYMIIASFALWVIGAIASKVSSSWPRKSLPGSLLLISKAAIYQAHHRQPKSTSARVVVGASWFVAILLFATYVGNLRACFTLPGYERPINTIADLVRRTDLTIFVRKNDPHHYLFKYFKTGIRNTIRQRYVVRLESFFNSNPFCLSLIEGKYAFFDTNYAHIRRLTRYNSRMGRKSHDLCRMRLSNQDVHQRFNALMINKNSWFAEQLNTRIRWMRSFGIINRLEIKNRIVKCKLLTASDVRRSIPKGRKLGLWQFQGALIIWFLGMGIASSTFLREIHFERWLIKWGKVLIERACNPD